MDPSIDRELRLLTREELDRIDIEDARAALREARELGTISLEEVKRLLGLDDMETSPSA